MTAAAMPAASAPSSPATRASESWIERRAGELFAQRYGSVLRRSDRLFVNLMIIQWGAAIAMALWLSPYAWEGSTATIHQHVYAAVLLGGLLTSLPLILARLYPGAHVTRYTIACAQMLWSALLIHLSGGRIETHFHVFGSLAILAFYRDWTVLIPATVVVAADHFIRGLLWPESVYGDANAEWWRFLEHAAWVVFIDAFLIINCVNSKGELVSLCRQQAELEESHERSIRVQRLAAVGQLAASVSHELRNPLSAIRNAHTYIERRLRRDADGKLDPKLDQFLGTIGHELDASAKIISNLLDFSRAKTPVRSPCPLPPLIEDAIRIVPNEAGVAITTEVPADLPVPVVDKDQMRQVIVNLVQNAVEALGKEPGARVVVTASGGGAIPWRIVVKDNGPGMTDDVADRVFQPLFSTKTKGTGLGLAVVQGIIERHGGTVRVERSEWGGAAFVIELPTLAAADIAAAAE